MIRGIRCSTTILEANLAPKTTEATKSPSLDQPTMRHPKHHRCNTFPGSKALTCEDDKVNGIAIRTRAFQRPSNATLWIPWAACLADRGHRADLGEPLAVPDGRELRSGIGVTSQPRQRFSA